MAGENEGGVSGMMSLVPDGYMPPPPASGSPGGESTVSGLINQSTPANTSPLKASYQSGKPIDRFQRGVEIGTRDVWEGVPSLATTALDALTWPGRAIIRAAGGTATAPSDLWKAAPDVITNATGAKPLARAETEDELARSRVVQGGASMVGPLALGALPGAAQRAAPAVGGTLEKIYNTGKDWARPLFAPKTSGPVNAATQVAGGGIGALTGDAAASIGIIPDELKPLANLVGNMAGATGVNVAASGVERAVNALTGMKNPLAAALQRLGIEPYSAGQVSEGGVAQHADQVLQSTPVGGRLLEKGRTEFEGQMGAATDRAAVRAGEVTNERAPDVRDPLVAGKVAQEKIRDWYYGKLNPDTGQRNTATGFPGQSEALRAPVEEVMRTAPQRNVDLSGYRAALDRAAGDARLKELPPVQQAFITGKIAEWRAALDKALPEGGTVNWDQANAIRQEIGNARGTPDVINNLGSDRLNSIYGGIAEDMGAAATRAGVGKQWKAYNDFVTSGMSFAERMIDKVITGGNPNQEFVGAEDAIKHLTGKTSAEDLKHMRTFIPEAADVVASHNLSRNIQAKPGKQGYEDTPSTANLLAKLRGMQIEKPQGYGALYDDPAVAQNVDDLLRTAGKLREMPKQQPSPLGKAILAVPPIPRIGAGLLGWQPVISMTGAQRAGPPVLPGPVSGVVSDQGQAGRQDEPPRPMPRIIVRPQPQ